MKQFERLFENPFSDAKITPARLANFAQDCVTRLDAANTAGFYTVLLDQLRMPLATLQKELGHVASSSSEKKSKTFTAKKFLKNFRKVMSDKKGVIADAIGGFDSPAYLEFYPGGVSEYANATIGEIPVLLNRLNTITTKYAAQLRKDLAIQLQGFEAGWQTVIKSKQQNAASLSNGRTERGTARGNLELALLQAVLVVASQFPGDRSQCIGFFDFPLLMAGKSHNAKKVNATEATLFHHQ